ncbi:autotransporter domain-containing protein [Luteibacter aegosomaticola]|uniref:autotransporter family protein n=1 Tax=Luteibacter aegosomaticola TaxID=2911538 RepID=UPI001FF8C82B|nr:autotransporter domain-containing protein [Luteibacter aegosomaticola]UPG92178.1 autotransporter domain-containing protein [Luteibacter aegosomaticola]
MAAHAAGATGKGVVIGIADTGVDATNPALSGKVAAFADGSAQVLNGAEDVVGRGTALAALAAGRSVGQFGGGVAPDATIASVRILPDTTPKDETYPTKNAAARPTPMAPSAFATANDLLAAHARIIVWGATDSMIDPQTYSFEAYQKAFQGGARDAVLFVMGAGSNTMSTASSLANLPFTPTNSNLQDRWLVVAALDGPNNDQLAAYANKCIDYFCISAPGHVQTLAKGSTAAAPVYEDHVGTSYAAAQVAGAAAILSSVYPTLGPNALRNMLVSTTDNLGPGVPGRLNVGRALGGPQHLGGDVSVAGTQITFTNDFLDGWLVAKGPGTLTMAGKSKGSMSAQSGAHVELMQGSGPLYVDEGSSVTLHGDVEGGAHPVGTLNQVTGVSGTLDLTPNTAGTHIRDGNLVFDLRDVSTLELLIGSPITVDGSATVHGTISFKGAVPGYINTSHQTVISAASVTGTFATTKLAGGMFLDTSLQYSDKEVWIDTTRLSVQAVAAATPQIARSAAALNAASRVDAAMDSLAASGATTPAVGTLLAAGNLQQASNEGAARRSLASLSGQLYAAGTAVTLANIDAGNQALARHIADDGHVGSWVTTLGAQDSMARSGFDGVSAQMSGNMVGHDLALGNQGFAGVAFARMASNARLSANFDNQRSRSSESMFYAGIRSSGWYGVGRVALGNFRGDVRRLLRFGDTASFAGGDADGHYLAGYGELGLRTHAGAFDVTPFVSMQYARIHRDGFQEADATGFGLATRGQGMSRWQGGLGMRAGSTWGLAGGTLHVDGTLAWQQAFATRGEGLSARYAAFSTWAPVEGIGLSQRAATVGMNAMFEIGDRTQLALGVDQRLASRDRSRSATGSFRWAW